MHVCLSDKKTAWENCLNPPTLILFALLAEWKLKSLKQARFYSYLTKIFLPVSMTMPL